MKLTVPASARRLFLHSSMRDGLVSLNALMAAFRFAPRRSAISWVTFGKELQFFGLLLLPRRITEERHQSHRTNQCGRPRRLSHVAEARRGRLSASEGTRVASRAFGCLFLVESATLWGFSSRLRKVFSVIGSRNDSGFDIFCFFQTKAAHQVSAQSRPYS